MAIDVILLGVARQKRANSRVATRQAIRGLGCRAGELTLNYLNGPIALSRLLAFCACLCWPRCNDRHFGLPSRRLLPSITGSSNGERVLNYISCLLNEPSKQNSRITTSIHDWAIIDILEQTLLLEWSHDYLSVQMSLLINGHLAHCWCRDRYLTTPARKHRIICATFNIFWSTEEAIEQRICLNHCSSWPLLRCDCCGGRTLISLSLSLSLFWHLSSAVFSLTLLIPALFMSSCWDNTNYE